MKQTYVAAALSWGGRWYYWTGRAWARRRGEARRYASARWPRGVFADAIHCGRFVDVEMRKARP